MTIKSINDEIKYWEERLQELNKDTHRAGYGNRLTLIEAKLLTLQEVKELIEERISYLNKVDIVRSSIQELKEILGSSE